MKYPMIYFIRGTCGGILEKEFPLAGILTFRSDDNILGQITDFDDPKVTKLKGHTGAVNGVVSMLLREESRKERELVEYVVKKVDGRRTIEGNYEGHWKRIGETLAVEEYRIRTIKIRLDSKVF